jgi:predicted GTPase
MTSVTENYARFLTNQLRELLPFNEVPIRLILRSRRREDD